MRSRIFKLFAASLALSLVGAVGATGQAFTPTQADLLSMSNVTTSFGASATSTVNSVTADAGGVLYDVNWDSTGEGFTRVVFQKESFNTDLSGFTSFDLLVDAIGATGVGVKAYVQTGAGFSFFETPFISVGAGSTELVSLDLTGLPDTNDVKQFGYQVFGPGDENIQGAQFRVRPVPEPATAALLGLGALAMTRRRKV